MTPPVEIILHAIKIPANPFTDITLDVVFHDPSGGRKTVPAFWAGGNRWKARYSSRMPGTHRYHSACSSAASAGLDGIEGEVEIKSYTGDNPLYQHGPLRISADRRHFEHADGAPFLWLADTWWKNLCKRLTWEGFQELTADRQAKGFNVVQIVCGPYPDEEMMEASWENEGGLPYETSDFSVVNPTYFDYADRRILSLVDAGLVPAIVGGWGRPQSGGKSTLEQVGLDGFKRHWRYLVARYGAYPTVWIAGGEVKDEYGPWSELASYIKQIDPDHHLLCYHSPTHPREALQENAMFDFDMVAIGHDGLVTAQRTRELLVSCLSQEPARPALCGEACYEGHMQTNFADIQRYLFWSLLLSGAAGHTYGAAGVWHASVEGDPGISPVYDLTTWKEGMQFPGSSQLGIGKRLLERYPWSRFQPHPEWVEEGCFAAGIPGEVRIVYMPKRKIYDWSGPKVKNLEPGAPWHVFYFDPTSGRTLDQGMVSASHFFDFQKPVPSPQDWVLVCERVP